MAAYFEIDDVIDPADSQRWIATLFEPATPGWWERPASAARTSTPGRRHPPHGAKTVRLRAMLLFSPRMARAVPRLLILAFAAPAAFAATFTVNTTADSSDAGGCTTATVCSLRDAVAAANAASGSTITLPSGDYVLNTGATPPGSSR